MAHQINEVLRDKIIQACVEDRTNLMRSDIDQIKEVARHGFRGFANLTEAELIQSFYDAALDEEHPEIDAQLRLSRTDSGVAG